MRTYWLHGVILPICIDPPYLLQPDVRNNMNILNHTRLHQKYFEELSKIPRASFQEKQCADYLVDFANQHHLACLRDKIDNVLIYKPASPGYEDHEPVLLQGHMDMVCEKVPGCAHDFDKDPISLYIDNGILRAHGTTLGADNGVGCAYMLAVLAMELPHPPLECAFTTREEVGLLGALALKAEYFKATRCINLDFGGGGVSTCVTSAGGEVVNLKKEVSSSACADHAYRMVVCGLKGGHSGSCLHLERGNAIKLCARILKKLSDCGTFRIVSVNGGTGNNAIARECEAIFTSSASEKEIRSIFESMRTKLRHELSVPEPGFETLLERTEAVSAFTEGFSRDLLNLMFLLPTGVRHKSLHFDHLPIASENLASVCCIDHQVEFQYSLRANKASFMEMMETELHIFAQSYGMDFRVYNQYPSWEYKENSKLRETLCSVFRARRGTDMSIVATHGGLECGIFSHLLPGLDIVTLGAATANVHTPEEQLDLASFDWSFELLTDVLKEL